MITEFPVVAEVFSRARCTAHTVVRLDFPSAEPFEVLRDRFEQAVPAVDPAMLDGAPDWPTVVARTMAAAPHAFLRYARLDASPVFALAGHPQPATTYLMGNHVFNEMMFRHDPAVLLYAPLRVTIHQDHDGTSHLSVDQPSTRFDSFNHPQITAVGQMLDQRLAELITALRLEGRADG
jgi:hypothetical protein